MATAESTRRPWGRILSRAWSEFNRDGCTDLAAALTYYSVLALFPAILALVSLLGLLGSGPDAVGFITDVLGRLLPADSAQSVISFIDGLSKTSGIGWGVAVGLLGALWSASGYVGGFSRAMNRIYDVPEGRPVWKLRPTMFAVTVVTIALLAIALVIVVSSGPVASAIGGAVGLGDQALTVWSWAKWPILVLVVVCNVALLYYATPNVRQPRFRVVSVGAFVAIAIVAVASAGFGFYVANFSSYNKTYGAVAGAVVLLLWLWLTNLALLFGGELDAELERDHQLHAGLAAEERLLLPLRDDSASSKKARAREEAIADAKLLRRRIARDS